MWAFMQTIAAGETRLARQMLQSTPALAAEQLSVGATRAQAREFFLDDIGHYAYRGDTALHIAAAGYQIEVARALVSAGAEVAARNRRGAQPLHYAADGGPGTARWNPAAQAATISYLIAAGADPNAVDGSGVAPLHRAVRTRCAAAVGALLDAGADPERPNKNGSTPMKLATQQTGRGGSGSPEAKAQQADIIRLLAARGVN
jgi:ankyrin repeat protein